MNLKLSYLIGQIKILWDKPFGWVLPLVTLLLTTYKFFPFPVFSKEIDFVVILFVACFLICFWYLDTGRWQPKREKQLAISILLTIDDPEIEASTRRRVKKLIRNLGAGSLLDFVLFKMLPTNHLDSTQNIKKYLNRYQGYRRALCKIEFRSGNDQKLKSKRIRIEKLTFFSKMNLEKEIDLHRTKISGLNDLKVNNIGKDWNYLEQNSFHDGTKIEDNLKATLLFFSGIHWIYERNYDNALVCLSALFEKEKSLDIEEKNKVDICLAKDQRYRNILLNLFVATAMSKYELDKPEEALRILKNAEDTIGQLSLSWFIYISLARLSYVTGNLLQAKKYTEEISRFNSNTPYLFLNRAFFAILENDKESVYANYKSVLRADPFGNEVNYVEIRDFLQIEKEKSPTSSFLFDIADLVMTKQIDKAEFESNLNLFLHLLDEADQEFIKFLSEWSGKRYIAFLDSKKLKQRQNRGRSLRKKRRRKK